MENSREQTAWLILRIGIAFCFLYAAWGGFTNPDSWVGWFPKEMRDIIPEYLLLKLWGAFELVIGLWILSGKKVFVPSLLASLSLLGLIATNLSAMDIIFRDVTILAATIALTFVSAPKK